MKKWLTICCYTVSVILSCFVQAQVRTLHSKKEFDHLVHTSKKPLLIQYFAQWCGACKSIAQSFDSLSNEPEFKSVIFAEVDVDKVPEVSKEKEIVGIPTFHYVQNGKQKKKEVGVRDPETFSDDMRSNLRTTFLLAQNERDPGDMDTMLNEQKVLGSMQKSKNQEEKQGTDVAENQEGNELKTEQSVVQKAYAWIKNTSHKTWQTIIAWLGISTE